MGEAGVLPLHVVVAHPRAGADLERSERLGPAVEGDEQGQAFAGRCLDERALSAWILGRRIEGHVAPVGR